MKKGSSLRFRVQSLALLLALAAPFALYWALDRGFNTLAALFFGVIALAMILTFWKG